MSDNDDSRGSNDDNNRGDESDESATAMVMAHRLSVEKPTLAMGQHSGHDILLGMQRLAAQAAADGDSVD